LRHLNVAIRMLVLTVAVTGSSGCDEEALRGGPSHPDSASPGSEGGPEVSPDAGAAAPDLGPRVVPAILEDADPNAWVEIKREKSGYRRGPIFIYEGTSKRFLLTGGEVVGAAHWDTEVFDFASMGWNNFYPKGVPYTAQTGPAGAPKMEKQFPLQEDNGVLRLSGCSNAWKFSANTHFQWALSPQDHKIYAYIHGETLAFDVAASEWSRLKASAFTKAVPGTKWRSTYGALAYDPVNLEILSLGGTSDQQGGTPGTWAYSLTKGVWQRVPPGSKELVALGASAQTLCRDAAAVVNACRNRFYLTESATEAKASLKPEVDALVAEAQDLLGDIKGAKLSGGEALAAQIASQRLSEAMVAMNALAQQVGGAMSSKMLASGQGLLETLEQLERALDAEPSGRAGSQMATDMVRGKIVLFGGSRLDSYLSDTWVYDCQTRRWEQRFPDPGPSPRAGHVLVWLPRSRRVLLAGSIPAMGSYPIPNAKATLPNDVWAYDLEKNAWSLLAQPVDFPTSPVAAVDSHDVVVAIGLGDNKERVTWAMKVDPAAAIAAAGAAKPGTIAYAYRGPADYDSKSTPDSQAVSQLLDGHSSNTWYKMPKVPLTPGNHDYSTASYDPARRQILWWGGGHSSYHNNDVHHYSLRTACWSTGYAFEYPYYGADFQSPINQSFNDRPFIETHVWDKAAYDPVSDRVVLCNRSSTWTYDIARREWDYPMLPAAPGSSYQLNMTSTPKGVVAWTTDKKLVIYQAKEQRWDELPLTGASIGSPDGVGAGMGYDSKRDAVWLVRAKGSAVYRYDMQSGAVKLVSSSQSIQDAFPRDLWYVSTIDMLLCATRLKSPDGTQVGNLAFDIGQGRWVGLVMPVAEGKDWVGSSVQDMQGLTLVYDPGQKLALFAASTSGADIRVARIAQDGLKKFDIPDA